MLVELRGKAGNVCEAAKQGQLRCPLIVRPTSEDAITGVLFQNLRAIQPRWWLPQMLNRALGTHHYRQQVFRNLSIKLWENQPHYPKHLLPWSEGSTQVDVVIRWENPATTVFLEAKFLSGLATTTSSNDGTGKYPNDQLIRNIRIGLWSTGCLQEKSLFTRQQRRFAMIVLAPQCGNALVAAYRDPDNVVSALPQFGLRLSLPPMPFVGELGYRGVIDVLRQNYGFMNRTEQRLVDDLTEYLDFKLTAYATAKNVPSPSASRALPLSACN